MKDLSFVIKFLDDHNITYLITMETRRATKPEFDFLPTIKEEDVYFLFIGHNSLKELHELVDLYDAASRKYGKKFPIYGRDTYLNHAKKQLFCTDKEAPIQIVHGNPSDFDKFPADLKGVEAEDKNIELKEFAKVYGSTFKHGYARFTFSFPFLLTALGFQLSVLYLLNPQLGQYVFGHFYIEKSLPFSKAMTTELPDDLLATLKYYDERNATYAIGKEDDEGIITYYVIFGHYSTNEFCELNDLWYSVSLKDDGLISHCISFIEYKDSPFPIVYGNLSDFEKFPADDETQEKESERLDFEENSRLLEIQYKKDHPRFPLKVLFLFIVLGFQSYLLYAWLTQASQQTPLVIT